MIVNNLLRLVVLSTVILFPVLQGCSDKNTSPTNSSANTDVVLDTIDAKSAYEYLNLVRSNPSNYSTECNYDISNIEARPALKYDVTLQKVAREKALDMARRNFFSHQNPEGKGVDHLIVAYGYSLDKENYVVDETTCNYESLQMAGTTAGSSGLNGIEAIRQLIKDGDMPDGGHRFHLLGVGDRKTLDECGIGFVRAKEGTMFKDYCCVIIAKRKK